MGQVDLGDALMTVIGIPDKLTNLLQANRVASKGLADEEVVAVELDAAVSLDPPYFEFRVVIDGRQDAGEDPGAGSIARAWYLEAQSLVRALKVVHRAVAVEGSLNLRVITPDRPLADDLQLEGAVKALVLALGLGMQWPAVRHADTEADQPGSEAGMRALAAGAPRGTIVRQHPFRQAVALEGGREMAADGGALLIRTGGKTDTEAGVVVQDCERVAASLSQGKVTLEAQLR